MFDFVGVAVFTEPDLQTSGVALDVVGRQDEEVDSVFNFLSVDSDENIRSDGGRVDGDGSSGVTPQVAFDVDFDLPMVAALEIMNFGEAEGGQVGG